MILMMKLKTSSIMMFTLIAVVITGAIAITAVYGQTTLSTAFTSPPPVPRSVIFDLTDATVYCADGTETNSFGTILPVLSTQLDTYSVSPSMYVESSTSQAEVGEIHIVWTTVSDDGMHYHLKGLINDHGRFCPGTDDLFPVKITGTCDGSIFAMTTPRINGYSVGANSTQVSAACIHP